MSTHASIDEFEYDEGDLSVGLYPGWMHYCEDGSTGRCESTARTVRCDECGAEAELPEPYFDEPLEPLAE